MTRVDPNSFAQNWLQGMQLGTGIAERRADFQNRYAMQDQAAMQDARDAAFRQQQADQRNQQWQADFDRSTGNDEWNQMADMRRFEINDAHLAIAQRQEAARQAQEQTEGEAFRALNRQMLGAAPSSSMLVPEGSPDFADPIRNTVEHGDVRAQKTLFEVLKDRSRRNQFEGLLQMIGAKQLNPQQVADPEMQALLIEAQNANDPSRFIGRILDLQREGQLRQAMMPATVTGQVDGPASPQEAQLGQMVQGMDGGTVNALAAEQFRQANQLGRYAPGKASGKIDPATDPEGFNAAVEARLGQLTRLYPNGNREVMRAAMEREVMTGRSEDLPPVSVTGRTGKLDTANEKALKLAFDTAEKRREEASKAARDNPDAAKQEERDAAAQRAEAAANIARRNLMEFYKESAAATQQPPAPAPTAEPAAAPADDTDAFIDQMIAAGKTDAEIEAALAKR